MSRKHSTQNKTAATTLRLECLDERVLPDAKVDVAAPLTPLVDQTVAVAVRTDNDDSQGDHDAPSGDGNNAVSVFVVSGTAISISGNSGQIVALLDGYKLNADLEALERSLFFRGSPFDADDFGRDMFMDVESAERSGRGIETWGASTVRFGDDSPIGHTHFVIMDKHAGDILEADSHSFISVSRVRLDGDPGTASFHHVTGDDSNHTLAAIADAAQNARDQSDDFRSIAVQPDRLESPLQPATINLSKLSPAASSPILMTMAGMGITTTPSAEKIAAMPANDDAAKAIVAADDAAMPGSRPAGFISRVAPFDPAAMDESIQNFLNNLPGRKALSNRGFSMRHLALVSFAAAGAVGEIIRRKKLLPKVPGFLSLSGYLNRTKTR
jgi:hypothetical protein